MRLLRKLGKVFLVLLALTLVCMVYGSYLEPPRIPIGEIVGADEQYHISQLIDSGLNLVNATRAAAGDGLYRRDAHAKTHGCVNATFKVNPTTDSRIALGVFAEPKSYKAWIRWSNADPGLHSDWAPDAHGMAIKLLGVPGTKLLPEEASEHTQDFVMVNNPVFIVRNIDEYAEISRRLGNGSKYSYFFPGLDPKSWRVREFRLTLGLLKFPPPTNLLGDRFYSLTAYRLGTGNFVKYSAMPVPCKAGGDEPGTWAGFGSNALGESLAAQLKGRRKYCFDFMVQFQRTDRYMPVEDATIEWKESWSPFIPVARIEIEPQTVSRTMANHFCENLAMTPWHALPEHEPVGALNRARKYVYPGSSRYRRCQNGFGFGEPLDDGSMAFDTRPCKATEPVPSPGER
jgi:hypothetical protein